MNIRCDKDETQFCMHGIFLNHLIIHYKLLWLVLSSPQKQEETIQAALSCGLGSSR